MYIQGWLPTRELLNGQQHRHEILYTHSVMIARSKFNHDMAAAYRVGSRRGDSSTVNSTDTKFCIGIQLQIKFSDIHDQNTRNKSNYILPSAKLEVARQGKEYSGPYFFNMLPSYLKDIANERIFKKSLKKFLLENTFYTFEDYVQFTTGDIIQVV